MSGSPTYRVWQALHARCGNPNNHAYADYGGRGITVCERWATFEPFLEDMGVRPYAMSLDRIDPNKGYEPSNCRWADAKTQSNNRRNSFERIEREFSQVVERVSGGRSPSYSREEVAEIIRALKRELLGAPALIASGS
jgi:hypothetical protein